MSHMFPNDDPSPFPTTSPGTYWPHSVAPYWSNADLRMEGTIRWKFFTRSDIDFSQVDVVISNDQNTSYDGSWMMVVDYYAVHPFPHGDDQTALYNQKVREKEPPFTEFKSKFSNRPTASRQF